MSTKIPITIEGNLTADPEYGETNETRYARFSVAVTERVLDETSGKWGDGTTKFHNVTAFGALASNVRDSLNKGDRALVTGELEFREWNDSATGELKQGTQVTASAVGPSLRFHTATLNRSTPAVDSPKVSGPDVSATGPVAQPSYAPPAGVTR